MKTPFGFAVFAFSLLMLGLPGPAPSPAADKDAIFVSKMGGKCLDAEGAKTAEGTRIIGYKCTGDWNQLFQWDGNGQIKFGNSGMCLNAWGGRGNDGDEIKLFRCSDKGANSQWRLTSAGEIKGINGKCLDLKGGSGHWFGNQPLIIWNCHGGDNQKWFPSALTKKQVTGAAVVQSGQLATLNPVQAQGGGMVAAGAGNIVAAGGGNIVAAGGGNILVGGAGIVAAGGGN